MVSGGDGPATGEQVSQIAMNLRLRMNSILGQHLTWGIAGSAIDGLWEVLYKNGRRRALTMDIYDGRWGRVATGDLGPAI